MLTWDRATALEAEFMVRLADRVEGCREFLIPGTGVLASGRPHRDGSLAPDYERETARILRAEGVFDPAQRDLIPRGARCLWEVRRGGLLPGGLLLVVFGCVVHPVKEIARGLTPLGRDASEAAELLPAGPEGVPAVLAALSTSGWRGTKSDEPGLHLFEPAPGGGFRRFGGGAEASPAYLNLETEAELGARVVTYAERSRANLVLRGLSARKASATLGVPVALVREVFAALARDGEFLRVSREGDDLVLRRA